MVMETVVEEEDFLIIPNHNVKSAINLATQ